MDTRASDGKKTGIVRPFLISLAATLVFVTIVLVSAGRVFWQVWVYAGMSLALNVGQRMILRANPGLASERAKPGSDARPWDKALLGVGLLLTLVNRCGFCRGAQGMRLAGITLSPGWARHRCDEILDATAKTPPRRGPAGVDRATSQNPG